MVAGVALSLYPPLPPSLSDACPAATRSACAVMLLMMGAERYTIDSTSQAGGAQAAGVLETRTRMLAPLAAMPEMFALR